MVERATKAYGVFYWDTFEDPGDDTFLLAEADTLSQAEAWVSEHYADRIRSDGADRVEIVDSARGEVVIRYNVG